MGSACQCGAKGTAYSPLRIDLSPMQRCCHSCFFFFTLHSLPVRVCLVCPTLLSEGRPNSTLFPKSSCASRIQFLCSFLHLSRAEENSRSETISLREGCELDARRKFLAELDELKHRVMLIIALWLLDEARLHTGSRKAGQTSFPSVCKKPLWMYP